MYSSQSSAKFKPNSRPVNRLELNDPASSQGSSLLQRQESSSMSLGSQELVSSRDSQQSPVRKLYQMYTSKQCLFTKNKKSDDANKCFQEPIAKEDNSIAVLNFLVKDLSEKYCALNENIEKTMQTAFNRFLSEIENQLEQKNLDQLDQFSNYENSRIKIAELEMIIHEKDVTIECLKSEVAKLSQDQESALFQRFYECLTSTLDTALAKYFKQANDEHVTRSKELELRMESMLNECLQELKKIVHSSNALGPVPLKKFETPVRPITRSGIVRASTGRKPKTASLKKSPLDFVSKELNPKDSRRSSPFVQRLSYNADRSSSFDTRNLKPTTPLSNVENMFMSVTPDKNPSFVGREKRNLPQSSGKRSWRRMSTSSFSSCQFTIAETSSEDLSFSSPEIVASKRKDYDDDDDYKDSMVVEDMRRMMIEKDFRLMTNQNYPTNAFVSKPRKQVSENDILWA